MVASSCSSCCEELLVMPGECQLFALDFLLVSKKVEEKEHLLDMRTQKFWQNICAV